MSEAAAALRAAVVLLLEAQGEAEISAVVAAAEIQVLPPETWSVGSRTVSAHRVALLLDAVPFAELGAAPAGLARIRGAFEAAMRSPATELADLAVLLRLPAIGRSWGHVYRDLPAHEAAPPPDDAAVLAGAAALLSARGDVSGAEVLARAVLESAVVPSGASGTMRRWVARLEPADLVRAQRSTDFADRIKAALTDAATRAAEAVASIELAAAVGPGTGRASDPAGRLQRALESQGGVVFVLSRAPGLTTLAWISNGELTLVDVAPAPRPVSASEAKLRRFVVNEGELGDEEAADRLAAAIKLAADASI